jgi:nicotinate-nucleotide pyrophosphorylase (carboxylating)
MKPIPIPQAARDNLHQLLSIAHEEDLGSGDVTGRLLPAALRATGRFIAREPLTICGSVFIEDIARAYDEIIDTEILVREGANLEPGDIIAEWFGPAWAVMAAERVALNFLQRLSGVASMTRRYVHAVAGTNAMIYDTRKTTPGWRALEKYAVRVGGGENHRMGLYDAVLVKDNHLAALVSAGQDNPLAEMGPKLDELRKALPHNGFVEIEVDTIKQYETALTLPVDVILLDNMRPAKLRKAIEMRAQAGREDIKLEASGGITLKSVQAVAETGVDRIALGTLTHSAPAADIALDIILQS